MNPNDVQLLAAVATAVGSLATAAAVIVALVSLSREKRRNDQLQLEQEEIRRDQAELRRERRRSQARRVTLGPVTIMNPSEDFSKYVFSVDNRSDDDISAIHVELHFGPQTFSPRDQWSSGRAEGLAPSGLLFCEAEATLGSWPDGDQENGGHRATAQLLFRDTNGVPWLRSAQGGLQEVSEADWAVRTEAATVENVKRGAIALSLTQG